MQSSRETYTAIRHRFVNWVLQWAQKESDNTSQEAMEIEMVDIVKMLRAIGFEIRQTGRSRTAFDDEEDDIVDLCCRNSGCRVMVMCTYSRLRIIMEAPGTTCKCPAIRPLFGKLQEDSLIQPFSEATAKVIREITERLLHVDWELVSTPQQTKDMNKSLSMGNLLSAAACHTPAQKSRMSSDDSFLMDCHTPALSSDDSFAMEYNQLEFSQKSQISMNSLAECLAESSSPDTILTDLLPNEQYTIVEQILKNGMDRIRKDLQVFYRNSKCDLLKNAKIEEISDNTLDYMRQALHIDRSENSSKVKSGLESLVSVSEECQENQECSNATILKAPSTAGNNNTTEETCNTTSCEERSNSAT